MPETDRLLRELARIGKALAETFNQCEVVVHDLRRPPQSSIVHIFNGHVSGRKVGDGIRDLFSILKSERFQDGMLTNYLVHTPDGRMLKSTTVIVRDPETHDMIAAFCVNLDLGRLLTARKIIDELVQAAPLQDQGSDDDLDGHVMDILQQIVDRSIQQEGRPVAEWSREDKIRLIGYLDSKEAFRIKGAVDLVADKLNVSRYTVYNYLEEARSGVARR